MMLTNNLADFISIQYGYNRLFKAKTSYADSGLNLLNVGPGERIHCLLAIAGRMKASMKLVPIIQWMMLVQRRMT